MMRTREACTETAGNPLQAFLLLWRATQVWPRSLRRLTLHWRALPPETQAAWRPTFPNSQIASFTLPDEQDYTEVRSLGHLDSFQGAVLGLLNLQTVYMLSIEGASHGSMQELSLSHRPRQRRDPHRGDSCEGKHQFELHAHVEHRR